MKGEHPSHRVRITRPYYLGTHEVTVADFQRFVTATGYKTTAEKVKLIRYQDGRHQELNWRQPIFDQQSTHPVTVVSWDDAIAFSQWLSREEGRTVRLPTEAEWEYACRAGTDTLFFWGDDPDAGEGYINAANETATPDGQAWMHKLNFKDGYAATTPVDDPTGPGMFTWFVFGSEDRVIRGGGWSNYARFSRSASRYGLPPDFKSYFLGFRVAFSSMDQSGQSSGPSMVAEPSAEAE